jgi:hypothetical protein
MLVRELIEALQGLNPEALVVVEHDVQGDLIPDTVGSVRLVNVSDRAGDGCLAWQDPDRDTSGQVAVMLEPNMTHEKTWARQREEQRLETERNAKIAAGRLSRILEEGGYLS